MNRTALAWLMALATLVIAVLELITPPEVVVLSFIWLPAVVAATFARPFVVYLLGTWAAFLTFVVGLVQGYLGQPSYWIRFAAMTAATLIAMYLAYEVRDREYRLEQLATTDPLTGLANRRFGHAGGDAALVEVADRFSQEVRGQDVLARFGGDEFVLLCPSVADPESVQRLRGRLADTLTAPLPGMAETPLGVTIGAVLIPPGSDIDADHVLDGADRLMMGLKAQEKGAFTVLTLDGSERI